MIWVYAICEQAAVSPLHDTGLGGAPLERVDERDLLAVISRHDELPDVSALDALWAHEQVVERLMAEGAVLPMRFGSRLPRDATLRVMLSRRHDELRGALDGVRGRVELAVRAVRFTGSGPTNGAGAHAAAAPEELPTGRGYLQAKLELHNRAAATGAALHAPLAAVAAADSRRPARPPDEVLRASYLVDRPAVAEFRGLAQRLQAEHPDVAFLCTGPWPPYSFVEASVMSAMVPDPDAEWGG